MRGDDSTTPPSPTRPRATTAERARVVEDIVRKTYGPFCVGEYVVETWTAWSFGRVVVAGSRQAWVVWESGCADMSRHAQDTRMIRRAIPEDWHGDPTYESKTKAEIERQVKNWHDHERSKRKNKIKKKAQP